MNTTEEKQIARQAALKMVLTALATAPLAVLGTIFSGLSRLILEKLACTIREKLLLGLSAILLILLLGLVAWVVYLKIQTRLRPRFGVYWDKRLNAYCPSCKQLLSHNNLAHFHCNHCKTPILLKSDKGDESIAVSTAKELLKELI